MMQLIVFIMGAAFYNEEVQTEIIQLIMELDESTQAQLQDLI